MKTTILFFMFFLLSTFLNTQQDSAIANRSKNSVFMEFGGNAIDSQLSGIFSLNYDRVLYTGKFIKTSARIGSSLPFVSIKSNSSFKQLHVIPLLFNLLIGKRNFFAEIGAGYDVIFINSNYKTEYGALTTAFGLRYQNYKKGIMARIGITPTIGVVSTTVYLGSIAEISVGYNF